MEDLDRGLVSVRSGTGNYVGWRLLGTDPPNVAFNLYRGSTRVNASPITGSTNLLDGGAPAGASYTVRAVVGGVERAPSERVDRFLAATAYLDGQRPSLVMARGYYTRTVLAAWDFRGGALTRRWTFDSNVAGSRFTGQGNHNLSVADVDGDGRDEILYGSMAVDDNGAGLYTGYGHGDAMHVGDLVPSRPGQEV